MISHRSRSLTWIMTPIYICMFACTEAAVSPQKPQLTSTSEQAVCEGTNGEWNKSLLACWCGIGEIFSPTSGCKTILNAGAISPTAIEFPGSLVFSMSPELYTSGLAFDDGSIDLSQFVGYAFEPGDEGLAEVEVGTINVQKIKDITADIYGGPQSSLTTSHVLEANDVHSRDFDKPHFLNACVSLLNQDGLLVPEAPQHCGAIAGLLHGLPRGQIEFDWQHTYLGVGNKRMTYSVAYHVFEDNEVTYRIIGRGASRNSRRLTVSIGYLLQCELIVDPRGRLIAGYFTLNSPTPPSSFVLYSRSKLFFEGVFSPLSQKTEQHGDRIGLRMLCCKRRAAQPISLTGFSRLMKISCGALYPPCSLKDRSTCA